MQRQDRPDADANPNLVREEQHAQVADAENDEGTANTCRFSEETDPVERSP